MQWRCDKTKAKMWENRQKAQKDTKNYTKCCTDQKLGVPLQREFVHILHKNSRNSA